MKFSSTNKGLTLLHLRDLSIVFKYQCMLDLNIYIFAVHCRKIFEFVQKHQVIGKNAIIFKHSLKYSIASSLLVKLLRITFFFPTTHFLCVLSYDNPVIPLVLDDKLV